MALISSRHERRQKQWVKHAAKDLGPGFELAASRNYTPCTWGTMLNAATLWCLSVHFNPHHPKEITPQWRMIWACFAVTGPGHLAVIESTMNSSVYQSIPESNVRPSL